MGKYCGKCSAELSDDDFLCPHCGAIWGDRIYHAPQVETVCEEEVVLEQPKAEEPTEETQPQKKQHRWLLPVAAAVLILGFVLLWLGSDRNPGAGENSTPSASSEHMTLGQIPQTSPSVPATNAPTTVPYTIQITTETEYWLEGITVHFCRNGKELWAQQVDSEGKVTFYATKGDGYSIRLSNLRPSLAYHYGDTEFLFPKDTTKLFCNLENKPIDYTVQVVNSADEPVRDVLVLFSSRNGQFVKEVLTDSEGYCVIRSDYDPVAYCQILSLPNEYALLEYGSKFEYDSFDTKIVLNTYGECGISAEQVYTVKLHDEYGEPLKDMVVQVSGFLLEDDSLEYNQTFRTNQQGCITFAGSDAFYYRVKILNERNYSGKSFHFVEGSRELVVELNKYTYTVQFVDQYGNPIQGVEMCRKGDSVFYSSDQEGKVSFELRNAGQERVCIVILHIPEDYMYFGDDHNDSPEVYFSDGLRNLKVTLYAKITSDSEVVYPLD